MRDAERCSGRDKEHLSKYFDAGVAEVVGEPGDFLCPDLNAEANGKICNPGLWNMGEEKSDGKDRRIRRES